MKWPVWVPGLLTLRRIERHLRSLADSQRRLADAAEGISPRGREVAPAESRDPSSAPGPFLHPPDDFLAIEQIESRLRRQLGRDPSAEEIAHELDGQEWGVSDLSDKVREKLGL